MKECSLCGVLKVVDAFYKRALAKDGLRSECKACTNLANKRWSVENPEAAAAISRAWIERNPEKRRAIKQAWSEANRESTRISSRKQHRKVQEARDALRVTTPRLFHEGGRRRNARELVQMAFPLSAHEKKALAKRYYEANRERILHNHQLWADRNRAYLRLKDATFSKDNRAYRNALNAERRRLLKAVIPSWADSSLIDAFYEEARQKTLATGVPHTVDHAVPLRSRFVQGLHCQSNLRVVTREENSRKSNLQWPDMWAPQQELFSE